MRRPPASLVISLIALFVALGGPAQAKRLIDGRDIKKGTVGSAQIKDRSIATRDLSSGAVRSLAGTPDASVTEVKIADAAVTTPKLAGAAVTGGKLAAGSVGAAALSDRSVTGSKIAPGAVGGDQVADGSLTTNDIARFSGSFRIAKDSPTRPGIKSLGPRECWSGEPRGLAPELNGADISQDLVLVTPGPGLDEKNQGVAFSVRNSSAPSRFVLTVCNESDAQYDPPDDGVGFRYAVLDIP